MASRRLEEAWRGAADNAARGVSPGGWRDPERASAGRQPDGPGRGAAPGRPPAPPADLSSPELARLVELGEGQAYAAQCLAAPPACGLRAARFGAAIALLAPRFPMILLNRVIGLGVAEPATEAQLDAILDLYRENGTPSFAIQLSPLAQPPELAGWLLRRGLWRSDNWAKMVRPAWPTAEIPTDLRIEVIGPDRAGVFAAVACEAFRMPIELGLGLAAAVGQPGWRHYLAYDGHRAVATATLYVNGLVGWLGGGSTLPAYRRRGAQGALMTRRINDGVALGCRWLITETDEDTPSRPNASYRNMRRTGFALAYYRGNYLPPPGLAAF